MGLGVAGGAFVTCLVLLPASTELAHQIGALDHPGDDRRVHGQTTPRMAGVALYVAFWLTMIGYSHLTQGRLPLESIGLFTGSLILLLLGMYDDMGDAPVSVKLPVQLIAAHLAYVFGTRLELVPSLMQGLGWSLEPSLEMVLTYGVTIFWILSVVNAINFMDGLDTLAAGLSLLAAVSLGLAAWSWGAVDAAVFSLALAGTLVAFIPFNLHPAKLFLGDSGSTFLGFCIAIIAASASRVDLVGPEAPFLVTLFLAIPLGDLFFTVVRRIMAGRSIFVADRGHVHHRLLGAGISPRVAAAIMLGTGLAFSGLAFLLM